LIPAPIVNNGNSVVRALQFLLPGEGSKGRRHRGKGKMHDAIKFYQQASEKDPKRPQSVMNLAQLYEQTGEISKAIENYEKVLEIAPADPVISNNLAYLYLEKGENPDRALELAQNAMEKAPENPMIMDTMGWIYYKKGLYPKAVRLFEQSVEKFNKDPYPSVYYHLGLAYRDNGQPGKAKEALEKLG